jgi:hypothetical protein
MKKNLLVLSLLIASLLGCSQQKPANYATYQNAKITNPNPKEELVVFVDSAFSEKEFKLVEYGLKQIELTFHNFLTVRIVRKLEYKADKYLIKSLNVADDSTIAETDKLGGKIILIYNNFTERGYRLDLVVVHEVLHSLGIPHIPNSIMAPVFDIRYQCITENVAKFIADAMELPLNQFSYCK